MESVKIFDIKIHKIGVREVVEEVILAIHENRKIKIFHLNAHAFDIAFKDEDFKKIINEGDIVFCDGFGVKIAAKILGLSIGERMTPPDWIDRLCETLKQHNRSVFLLGDEKGIAERCAAKLVEKTPGIQIAGTHHGFFEKSGPENIEVIKTVNDAKPDVLLVGFGMPLQEKWIYNNSKELDAPVIIAVGAMFRWMAGEEKRAPKIFSDNGFEGVWRLFSQPGKVWKRYIIEFPLFIFKAIRESIKNKFVRKSQQVEQRTTGS